MKFRGTVVSGVGVGAKFGIATANISVEMLPKDLKEGVYFVRVSFDSQDANGLLHFGPRKTFGASSTIEIHLLDTDTDLYGKTLDIEILKRERDVEQFQNADALFTQIEKDIVRARKFFVRLDIQNRWKQLSDAEKTSLAEKALIKMETNETFRNAQNVFVYAPIEGEIEFVQKMCSTNKEKTFFFPRIEAGEMTFYPSSWEALQLGSMKILEPVSSSTPTEPDLVVVPAVAVDSHNHRLGRGGGFYDRFLENFTGHTIVVVPKFALVEKLPIEGHDVRVWEVIVV